MLSLPRWIARGYRVQGHWSVTVEWKISDNKFWHGGLAYIKNVLILSYKVVGIVGVGEVW